MNAATFEPLKPFTTLLVVALLIVYGISFALPVVSYFRKLKKKLLSSALSHCTYTSSATWEFHSSFESLSSNVWLSCLACKLIWIKASAKWQNVNVKLHLFKNEQKLQNNFTGYSAVYTFFGTLTGFLLFWLCLPTLWTLKEKTECADFQLWDFLVSTFPS